MVDAAHTSDSTAPAVCVSCPFGAGDHRDCALIQGRKLARLLEEGPCRLGDHVTRQVGRLVRSQFPLQAQLVDDIAQEGVLKLLEREESFPGEQLGRLVPAQRWLNQFARNHLIDYFRKSRVITKLRCGACVHFTLKPSERCTLEFLPDHGSGLDPNPWWGEKVSRRTDPRTLDPTCDQFIWRRPGTYDIFEDDVVELPTYSPNDLGRLMVLALDRLAAASERGVREAAVLRRHYLSGDSVGAIAEEGGVSEKTVKRLLASGRESLLSVLTREFAVESVGELVA